MLREAVMKMKVLQNPSNEIVSMLVQIYNTPVNNQDNTTAPGMFSNSIFAQQQESPFQQNHSQPTSIFALANQQLFGKNTAQQQSNFTPAPTNTNTIFSGAVAQSANQSIFSGGNSLFNKQQTFTGNNNAIGSMIGSNQSFVTNTQSNSPFGATQQQSNSPFGSTNNTLSLQQNNSPFGAAINTLSTQQNNSPFGTTNNTLSTQQNKSPFGTTQQNNIFNQSNNVFKTQTQNLPFQNQTNNNPLFANQSPTNSVPAPTNSTFNFATAAAANLSSSPFMQQPQQTNIFATNSPQQNTSPFQQQPHNNAGNIFNNPSTGGNMFKGSTSIFANNQAINSEQKSGASIFAQDSVQTVVNLGSEVNDSSAYSKLEDLTENEIKWFESESFEFGKIPEKPPTAQMCL